MGGITAFIYFEILYNDIINLTRDTFKKNIDVIFCS